MEGTSRTSRYDAPDTVEAKRDEQSIASLLRQLRDDTTKLFRQEMALAKTEMSEKANRVSRNLAYLAVGGAVAYGGVILLLVAVAAFVAWLLTLADVSNWVAAWLGLLIVGAVVAAIGYALVQKAINRLKAESPVPEKTVETLKEDKQWAQNKVT
jgi:xanthine/uracil permease